MDNFKHWAQDDYDQCVKDGLFTYQKETINWSLNTNVSYGVLATVCKKLMDKIENRNPPSEISFLCGFDGKITIKNKIDNNKGDNNG